MGGSNKRLRGMAGIGNSIIHGAGFINIYSNPVINFGRATSRGVKQRKWKKHEPNLLPDINEINGLSQNRKSFANSNEGAPFENI
jgi:hypothetical protein